MKWFRRPSDAPLWRDEFPVFTADEKYVSRRQLTKFLTLTSLAMFAGNCWIVVKSWFARPPLYPVIPVAHTSELPVGGVKVFAYPAAEESCILVRTGEQAWAAYSQKCTHLSCAVYYDRGQNLLACPCHQGFFSIADGAPVQGPPQRPLPRVVLERRGETLVAVGMDIGGRA